MMHVIKSPAFFRPSSRPSSPLPVLPMTRPDSEGGGERAARSLHKLSLSTFRKASPAPVPKETTQAKTTLIQDRSYLEALGLKVGEAVSRALVQSSTGVAAGEILNGKGPIPAGRGRALGALITAEIDASHGNVHLQRAILRLLQRPLSVLVTNLSTQLLPLLTSSAFLPTPMPQHPNLTPIQVHALALARFASELLACFDELKLDPHCDPRGDSLKSTKEGLASLVSRVTSPLIQKLKDELVPQLQTISQTNVHHTPHVTTRVGGGGSKTLTHVHPSIVSLQPLMPLYGKVLSRCSEMSSAQNALTTFVISIVWQCLVTLAYRPSVPRLRANSDPPQPMTITASASSLKKRIASGFTPPSTPPTTRFKLPPSRPPSPSASVFVPNALDDARALYDMLSLFPKPKEEYEVAREAVDEAFEALAALTALLAAVCDTRIREDLDLELITTDLPVLIALPILLGWLGYDGATVIPAMLGLSETDYRESCLAGFGRADECTSVVGERVLEVLRSERGDNQKGDMVIKWLSAKVEAA